MISQYTSTRIGGSATAADHVTTATFTRTSGLHGIVVGIGYNADFIGSPVVSVTFGTDNLAFMVAQSGIGGNETVEIWAANAAQLTAGSGVITVSFAGGSSLTIIVDVAEFSFVGGQGPGGVTNSAFANTTPATVSVTTSATSGGRKGTYTVPATDNAVYGFAVMYQPGLSAFTISTGTQIMGSTAVGAGALEICAASAWTQGTGGSDTIAWTFTLAPRDWAEAVLQIEGGVIEGILKAGEVMPAFA
jgi:hypothetical protein